MNTAWELRFYRTRSGRCQVRDYLRSQSKAVRGRAGWLLEQLQREGIAMERPQAGYLEAGIHELRVIAAGDQHRILYFFSGRAIIATNAFLKKTDRVPAEETLKAKTARADWLRREKGE